MLLWKKDVEVLIRLASILSPNSSLIVSHDPQQQRVQRGSDLLSDRIVARGRLQSARGSHLSGDRVRGGG